ncbi:beta-amyrin 28-monooxygenase-like [Rhododendron vialii]|uniref:beta-amyrin 28-monooxygenase-like n=1 Tax=Rhododendron vialii TaxID=182163 RepID=UPI00265F253B|nr:beta-amyrin 28-monooxygenase-like [Rhododendron vialii]
MEAFSLAIAFLVIFFTISFFAFRNASSSVDSNLPPGGSGWPIVGETLDFMVNPEKFVSDRMKKHSPDIFRTNFFGEKIVIICGPNGHKFLFSNEDKHFTAYLPKAMQKLFFSTQVQNSDKVLSNDEMKLPRFMAFFLKPEALVNYVAGMDSIIQKQLKTHLEGKAEVKMYTFCRSITLTLACRFFLGLENPERIAKLVGQFDKVTHGIHNLPLDIPGTALHYAVRAAGMIRKELADVLAEKRARVASGAPTQDVCTSMVVEGMSDEDISEKIMGVLVAGYSTVANTITFFMKFVGERPDVYHKILSEQLEISKSKQAEELLCWGDMQKMKYSWAVVCESMRVIPPVLGTFREAKTDFSYGGFTVPKGWKVFWTVNTTQRNPEYFREPYKFDPSRFMEGDRMPLYTFVPFGGGPRICPGKEYARFVILAFIHNLVKKFKWEVVDPNERVLGGMMPYPEKGLPVRLHPRYD